MGGREKRQLKTKSKAMLSALAMCLASACASGNAPSVSTAPLVCASAEFREFDFWIGDWDVTQHILQPDGSWLELPARTQVSASPDGCVLTEHWSGRVQFFWEGMQEPETMWGFSVRRFDPAAHTWAIYWMDQRSPQFQPPHIGGFDNGAGAFYRDFEVDGQPRRTRITFAPPNAGRVDWELAISADNGATWTPLWRMEMRRTS